MALAINNPATGGNVKASKCWNIINAHSRAKLACERVSAVLNGQVPDRVPFSDNYWLGFTERYLRERGLPPGSSLAEHFDHDLVVMAPVMGPWPSAARELEHAADA